MGNLLLLKPGYERLQILLGAGRLRRGQYAPLY